MTFKKQEITKNNISIFGFLRLDANLRPGCSQEIDIETNIMGWMLKCETEEKKENLHISATAEIVSDVMLSW